MGPFTHNQILTLEIETIIFFIELNNSIVEYVLLCQTAEENIKSCIVTSCNERILKTHKTS